MAARESRPAPDAVWTHQRFFEHLGELSPLRIISIAGGSVFEALCDFGPFGIARGHMNAMTDAYHWHVDLARFRHLRSRDTVHARSGRRVLFFELAEGPEARPFLSIYLYRDKDVGFGDVREKQFLEMHAALEAGVALEEAA